MKYLLQVSYQDKSIYEYCRTYITEPLTIEERIARRARDVVERRFEKDLLAILPQEPEYSGERRSLSDSP